MKKFCTLIVWALLCLLLVSCAPSPEVPQDPSGETSVDTSQPTEEEKKSIRILAIGNSFSKDSLHYLWQMLKQGGYEQIQLGIAYIGGSALDQHWAHMNLYDSPYIFHSNIIGLWAEDKEHTIHSIMTAANWDIITIQQQSVQAGQPGSFGNLENILNWIGDNKTNPDAKVYWNMTWAYEDGCTKSNAQALYNCEQSKMYQAITDTTQQVILNNSRIHGIIPCGTSIQNLRGSYIGEAVCRDGYHLNDAYGRYTAALTLYAMFTGSDLSEITWVPEGQAHLTKDLEAIREAVLDALAEPFRVSECAAQPAQS